MDIKSKKEKKKIAPGPGTIIAGFSARSCRISRTSVSETTPDAHSRHLSFWSTNLSVLLYCARMAICVKLERLKAFLVPALRRQATGNMGGMRAECLCNRAPSEGKGHADMRVGRHGSPMMLCIITHCVVSMEIACNIGRAKPVQV